MTILNIVTAPAEILERKAEAVDSFTPELQQLINNMIETMRAANGVGLAAPQVGEGVRLAVIETLPEIDDEGRDIPESRELHVIINPEIYWRSRQMVEGVEGCLSIPGYVGEVERHDSIRVRALNRAGKQIDLRLKGWDARIFQHEIDHLDGILYIDRLADKDSFWTEEEFETMLEKANEESEQEDAPEQPRPV
jgi:peptide deformylase